MDGTDLTVPFAQKDKAKALGARWDGAARQWFVPVGLSLEPFQSWLPAGAPVSVSSGSTPSDSRDVAPVQGTSLSQLLMGVAKLVHEGFRQGVWTRVEVVNVTAKQGNVYLELSERDQEGRVLAQARGTIWARTAEKILPQFQEATGAMLAPGIKLLVFARPVFKAQYGFSLDITSIDPSYTVGDLEAQKRKIRARLKEEELFERNRRLPSPWDFTNVLVVAPEGGAGLGDFMAEAHRLHRHSVCHFVYVHSRFQGEGAAAEIVMALQGGIEQAAAPLDAVILIRGGGAVNDLAWLNDYELARFICVCPVPVLTGIGHERDRTLLDEVAHRSYDTPSKVIADIEQCVARRAAQAHTSFEQVAARIRETLQNKAAECVALDGQIRAAAVETVGAARDSSISLMANVRVESISRVRQAQGFVRQGMHEVRASAPVHVHIAKRAATAEMATVQQLARSSVVAVRRETGTLLPAVLDSIGGIAARTTHDSAGLVRSVIERTQMSVRLHMQGATSRMREIAGQGPEKTLTRGFAMVTSDAGKSVTSAAQAKAAGTFSIGFKDGSLKARLRPDDPADKGDRNGN
ncbi:MULTISPECIES: exodeoxyribonuclease VII large subunit [unclassified Variovorax]|uniref:exodeoxyribonuclease VII large subunit n=1 Tax=unclassified Variovorax TaxID=663243 RepID=UPI0002B62CB7|nr:MULTISPECIES: exodeoxyribonuclease VII large subunit [unclassified Variovorax]AGF25490.1 hypothetical protein [Variovorax sp. WDL1]PNG50543.1 Exodeoxyribonuclease 7 large subunit [Variovorax sp. B2]VTU42253.1 Exodeoxyribonuclease 7 large subunit [Variovorax sp. RA8]VTV17707.1 Exodeoxyribonuclease 7 large subunit [Variovorax sp. WDL1]